jgi:hypothetical protein
MEEWMANAKRRQSGRGRQRKRSGRTPSAAVRKVRADLRVADAEVVERATRDNEASQQSVSAIDVKRQRKIDAELAVIDFLKTIWNK